MHEGALVITGSVATSLEFWHADGTSYGEQPAAPLVDVQTQVFQALRGLGFKERDAKQALGASAARLAERGERQQVLRHCLGLLTERAWSHA